jgi:transcriptional regulator with XRE-family HTH domain
VQSEASALDRIGRRLAALRAQKRWTQELAAEKLGVSVVYLRRAEAGKQNFTIRSLLRFAELYRVPLAKLFTMPVGRAMRRPGRPRKREE